MARLTRERNEALERERKRQRGCCASLAHHPAEILLWTIIHFRLFRLAVPKKPYRVAQVVQKKFWRRTLEATHEYHWNYSRLEKWRPSRVD
jgi:hypothetical protein